MRTATYIGELTRGGVDPKVAQTHGEALEKVVLDDYVTKDHLDAKLADLKAEMLKYLVGQTFAIGAIVFALLRLVK